jgi:hypothetical protein
MASYDGAIGIKTIRDDETKIILVDGASGDSATKKLSVVGEGDAITAATNDFGVPMMVRDENGDYKIFEVGAGSSVTVTATDLDIRDLTHVSDSVKIGDGTDFAAISDTGEVSVSVTKAQAADGAAAPAEALQIAGKDGSGNLQVLSTDTAGKLNVNAVLGQIPAADMVCEFFTQVAGVVNTEYLFFYVVPSGRTFYGKTVQFGSDGKILGKFGTSSDGLALDGQKFQSFQQPKDTKDHACESLVLLGDGTAAICVAVTPKDGAADDIFATLQGFLI